MKNPIFLLLIILSTSPLFSQIKEGHVTYKMEMDSDNPDMQMAAGMMQGSSMEVYFKDKLTRAEFKMGTMMSFTTITDEKSGDGLMLMDGIMGQTAIKFNADEISKDSLKNKAAKMDVTLTDETKKIEGYHCKKVLITGEEGMVSTFWVTEEIYAAKKGQSYLNEKVPGFPMQFELNSNGFKMNMTVTKVEPKLTSSNDLFNMSIPNGYKEMTMDQLKQMGLGGMK